MDAQKRSFAVKLRDAIKEKRLYRSLAYFILRHVLSEQEYVKATFAFDYRFRKSELSLTRSFIAEISSRPKHDKIKLVFVVWMTEMWNSLRSVYEVAAQNPDFDVYILAQPHITDVKNMQGQNPAYILLSSLYGSKNVLNACEHGNWFDLAALQPDYVFYSYPYELYYHELYKASRVREFAKICLIQYGYNFEIDATFCISHNFDFLKNVALHFTANETIKTQLEKCYARKNTDYPKIEHFGYSRFDLLTGAESEVQKNCVLWTPRWTDSGQKFNKQSHFLSYYKQFLSFAEKHVDIHLIIRPHPLMFGNFLRKGVMAQDEIDAFKAKCAALRNMELDENADYIPSVDKAAVIVSDFSALLAEYFVMQKPVIYCDGARGFSKEALIMDSALYHASKWEEIESQLLALLSGVDELKDKRKSALKAFLPQQQGTVAEHILSFIKDDYFGAAQ